MTKFEEIFNTDGIEEMNVEEIETIFNQFQCLLKNDSYSEELWRIYTEISLGENEENMAVGELKTPFVDFCQKIFQRIISLAEQASSREEIDAIQPLLKKFLSGHRRSGENLSESVKEELFLPPVETAGGKFIQKRNAFGEFCFLYIYQEDGKQQKLERVWYELLKNQINDKKNALINDENLTGISVLAAFKTWKMRIEQLIDENIKDPELRSEAYSFLTRAGIEFYRKKNEKANEGGEADEIWLNFLKIQISQQEEQCKNDPNIGEEELKKLEEGSFFDIYFDYENTHYLPRDFIENKIRSSHIKLKAKKLVNEAEERVRKIIREKLGGEVELEDEKLYDIPTEDEPRTSEWPGIPLTPIKKTPKDNSGSGGKIAVAILILVVAGAIGAGVWKWLQNCRKAKIN